MKSKMTLLAAAAAAMLAAPARADTESAPAPPAPPPPEATADAASEPFRVQHKGLFSGGLRIWSVDGDSVTLAGIELGGNVHNHVAVGVELMTNIEGDPMDVTVGRIGLRAYLLPGAFSPYAAARVGGAFGSGDSVGIWTASLGAELAVEPSGLLFDVGVGKVGAFGEDGTPTEISLSIGKRY